MNTNFYSNKMPKEGYECICLSVIEKIKTIIKCF